MAGRTPERFVHLEQAEQVYAGGIRTYSAQTIPRPFRSDAYEAFFDNGGIPRYEGEPPYDLFKDPIWQKVQRINNVMVSAGAVAVIGERAITDMSGIVPDGVAVPGVSAGAQEVRQEAAYELARHIRGGQSIHIVPAQTDRRMLHPDYFSVGTDHEGWQQYIIPDPYGGLVYDEMPDPAHPDDELKVVAQANYKLDYAIRHAMPQDEALDFLYRAAEQL